MLLENTHLGEYDDIFSLKILNKARVFATAPVL
jgi:hypothetical protein